MAATNRSVVVMMPNETLRLILIAAFGIVFGFVIGASLPTVGISKINFLSLLSAIELPLHEDRNSSLSTHVMLSYTRDSKCGTVVDSSTSASRTNSSSKIYVPTNPRGAETLPPGIVVSETDLYLRRLWGKPSEDIVIKQKYLVVFSVGFEQRDKVNSAVSKFSENFTILLFHYDGRTSEWDQFEWSKRAIHISARKQTKWWFAKRFLHPDVVAPFDYIFIWDEDLGVEHFNAETYLQLVRKHGLEISQPGLAPNMGVLWQMTRRRDDSEVHKKTQEKPGWCSDPNMPPCAAFIEIMAPVFSRKAWKCVWHMIQNDLVHGWGLDFALWNCVEAAHEKIGVVDAQWIEHGVVPSLRSQGEVYNGSGAAEGVEKRCRYEWKLFEGRLEKAKKEYLAETT